MNKFVSEDQLPKKSLDFCDEITGRCTSAIRSLEISYEYKNKKPTTEQDFYDFRSIAYITKRFAILEIATIFDSQGRYSLKVEDRKKQKFYTVKIETLVKNFPKLNSSEIIIIKKEIDLLLKNNTNLIKKVFDARNERVAHAGKSHYQYEPKSILHSKRFPYKKIITLAKDFTKLLTSIAIYHVNKKIDIFKKNMIISTKYRALE